MKWTSADNPMLPMSEEGYAAPARRPGAKEEK